MQLTTKEEIKRKGGKMKGRITNIEEGSLGDVVLIVEINLGNLEFEKKMELMDARDRIEFHKTDEYSEYLDKLEEAPKDIHLGDVEITYIKK